MLVQAAIAAQQQAARDSRNEVRVVAGPGTGKSGAVEERVCWLLSQGVSPQGIRVVSFTRASSLELRERVHKYAIGLGQPTGTQVRVTTLHSLALQTLRAANLLGGYPADPLVMDDWELRKIYDAEFGEVSTIASTERRALIREEHEAFWSTGSWNPPNYLPPAPPITQLERDTFEAYHAPRAQTYSCVLPGEIVRQCVSHMSAGTLNAAQLLGMTHLVVDEYQDLNPMDLEFIDRIVAQGTGLFAGGDDDQSIYSFRYANPAGLAAFATKYPASGSHTLDGCFRCTPQVVAAALALIRANAHPNRIPKSLVSLYDGAVPPVSGHVHRWRFASGAAEARSIATSCRDLVADGMNPRDMLVLVSNARAQLPMLAAEFTSAGIAFEPPRSTGFIDTDAGRMVLALVRIVCDEDDYVAHRVLLGILPRVGVRTCNAVAQGVLLNNLNYRDIFYDPLPSGVFSGRVLRAVERARALCAQVAGWNGTDTLAQRGVELSTILSAHFAQADASAFGAVVGSLPGEMQLEEFRDYLWADTDEQRGAVLRAVLTRLGQAPPETGVVPARVRVMTMHGAKGLNAQVVFVPGLEQEILPGPRRQPFPGLVLEAARLLYVSITRARVACVLSYAGTRVTNGQFTNATPSRFTAQVGGAFIDRASGLDASERGAIIGQLPLLA